MVQALPGESSARTFSQQRELEPLEILWLALLWASGSVLVAGRVCLAHGICLALGLRRHAPADRVLGLRVAELSRNLGLRRRVRVIASARLTSPIAFGLLKPTVALPLDFGLRFAPNQQEAMLAHELAHLAARDPFWHLLADIASAVFWWHPAVWWLRYQLQVAGELAADEASLLVADGPRALAESLVALGVRLSRPSPLGQLRVEGFRSQLGRRVQRLLHLQGRACSPPRRLRSALISSFGPLVLTAIVILCGAWAAPQALKKGNSMTTMQQNWKNSLAAFALLVAMGNPHPSASAAPMAATPAGAEAAPTATATDPHSTPDQARVRRELMSRYGLSSAPGTEMAPLAATVTATIPQHGAQLEAKLKSIIVPEISYDGLPLGEVVRNLSDLCRRLDPAKVGVNFVINPNPTPVPAGIDPSTGLPRNALPTEVVDLCSINIKLALPLRNLTMKDLLDVIVKVADRPMEYSLEDYAVVFASKPGSETEIQLGKQMFGADSVIPRLTARTYKVDTNTFVAGLESAFGIKVNLGAEGSGTSRSRVVQSALKDLLVQLGLTLEGSKSIFYNEMTGVVMVRARPDEMETVTAAMLTLGGALGP